ncbi:MAG: phosphoadenylyl-sulfate reductase [Pseudomonadota bacterium]
MSETSTAISNDASRASDRDIACLTARISASETLDERVRWIVQCVPGRIGFSTSLGIEDQAILHAIADCRADIDIFTIDTGRLFAETLDVLAASERRYGLKIRVLVPADNDVEAVVQRDGVLGFRSSVAARKACCHVRKVLPLRRGLANAAAWMTGVRREQTAGRAGVPFADWDADHGVIKLNPIADWSLAQLNAYVADNDIPVNDLHAKGFPSIGCQTCTRPIQPGEDIRAGRWWWEHEDGKECGLHNNSKRKVGAR